MTTEMYRKAGNMVCSLDTLSSNVRLERSHVVGIANKATEALIKITTGRRPLWIRRFGTGHKILK